MALGIDRGMREEAEHVQTVVQRHDNRRGADRATGRKLAPIVIVGFAVEISAAVDPNDDRLLAMTFPCRKDIQVQAVLAGARWSGKYSELIDLRAGLSVVSGVQRLGPVSDGLRGPPAKITHRWRRVGDSQKNVDPVLRVSTNGPLRRIDDRTVSGVTGAFLSDRGNCSRCDQ